MPELEVVNQDSNATAYTFVVEGTATDENGPDAFDETVIGFGDYAIISGLVKGSPGTRTYTFTGAVARAYVGEGDTLVYLDGQQVSPDGLVQTTGGTDVEPPTIPAPDDGTNGDDTTNGTDGTNGDTTNGTDDGTDDGSDGGFGLSGEQLLVGAVALAVLAGG